MDKSSYRDLIVWQKAIELVPTVYASLRQFPAEENFALSQQIRRSVVSVPANIAEGQARNHRKEFVQHLAVAKGSLAELDTLLTVAQRLGYVSEMELSSLEDRIADIRRPLTALMQSMSSTHNSQLRTHNSQNA